MISITSFCSSYVYNISLVIILLATLFLFIQKGGVVITLTFFYFISMSNVILKIAVFEVNTVQLQHSPL